MFSIIFIAVLKIANIISFPKKASHLLYIDDIKIFAKNQKETWMQTVRGSQIFL